MTKTLVIFDCDGTLVDTEYLCAIACVEAFKPYGINYTPEAFLKTFLGKSHQTIIAEIKETQGIEIPFEPTEEAFIAHTRRLIPTEMKVFPETLAFVKSLAKRDDLVLAVGSNGNKQVVANELEYAGYAGIIPKSHVFTVEDVANPKPAPDLFLHAAKTLGFAPSQCYVVEDSPTGARAGVAAGMTVIGYTGFAHDVRTQGATLEKAGCFKVIDVFSDLADVLSEEKVVRAAGLC